MIVAGQTIRRIVTTHDETGKAVVLFDSATPYKVVRPDTGIVSQLMWSTDATPADMAGKDDRAAVKRGIAPPPNGSIFRVVDFPPEDEHAAPLDHHAMGLPQASGRRRQPGHPHMHFTRSVDYAIILSGEIDMLLDDTQVHLTTGDVVIQQGTNHAWVNRSGEPCRVAFILIDAIDPLAD